MTIIQKDGKMGRLIDEDDAIRIVEFECGEWTGLAKEISKQLKQLPSAQQWIPCSERLPEEKDYKSCMECLDGAVWYFTENGEMGLGYYYKSTKEWSTTDDLKTDGKVIAWMPLPAPFKAERREDG